MRIIHAMGLLDTPRAQASLVSMFTQDVDTETNQFRALRALTQGDMALSEEAVLTLMAHTEVALQRQSDMDHALLLHKASVIGALHAFDLDTGAMQTITTLAEQQNDHQTRRAAIKTLGAQTHRKTEAAAMLRHLLQNESNKANLKRAAKAIAELEQEGG